MKSYRTTIIGIAAAVLLIGFKVYQHEHLDSTDIMAALGLLGIGSAAKDAAVHSTRAEVHDATVEASPSKQP